MVFYTKFFYTMEPYALLIGFVILLFTFFKFFKLRDFFKSISRKTKLFLIGILFLQLILLLLFSPFHDPVRSGGTEYMASSKSMFMEFDYATCVIGSFNDCLFESAPFHVGAYPFSLQIPFLAFGLEPDLVIAFNFILTFLLTIIVFLIAQNIFNNEKISILASLLVIFIRPLIAYSTTAEVAIFNIFIIALTFLFMTKYLGDRQNKYLFLFVPTICFAAMAKSENIVLFIVFAISVIIYNKPFPKLLSLKKLIIPLSIFIILVLCVSTGFIYKLGEVNDPLLVTGSTFDIDYAIEDIPNLIHEFAAGPIFLLIGLIFAIIYLFKTNKFDKFDKLNLFSTKYSGLLSLLVYSTLMITFHLLFFQKDMQRYILPSMVIISIVAAFGLFQLYILVKKHLSTKHLVAILIIASFIYLILMPKTPMNSPNDLSFAYDIGPDDWLIVPNWNDIQMINFVSPDIQVVALFNFGSNEGMSFLADLIEDPKVDVYFMESSSCGLTIGITCDFVLDTFYMKVINTSNNERFYKIISFNT